jgi:hypothetical protein
MKKQKNKLPKGELQKNISSLDKGQHTGSNNKKEVENNKKMAKSDDSLTSRGSQNR